MNIRQLSLFSPKTSFNGKNFESPLNQAIFTSLAESVALAFDKFTEHDITYFDKTCRSNMLNNLVVRIIAERCTNERFYMDSLTHTRRKIAILDDEYIFLFKKIPVVNLKTKQDDLIKHQELDKHVLILTYKVDEFWSEITRLEFKYFQSPRNVTYTYDITHLMQKPISIAKVAPSVKPKLTIKKEKNISKDSKAI